jgi:hypothetical protein
MSDKVKVGSDALSIARIATVGAGVQEACFEGESLPLSEVLDLVEMDLDEINSVRVERSGSPTANYTAEKAGVVPIKDGDKVFLKPAVRGGK